MIVIAQNLSARNKQYMDALKKKDAKAITQMAKELAKAGADIINVQCSVDGSGDADIMPVVVKSIVEATGLTVSLDSRNIDALKKSIPLCDKPPIINFISATEPSDHKALLSLVADTKASIVIRASKGVVPTSLEAKLQIIEDLIEEANTADIPNERLYADPSIVHIGRGMGQDHLVNSHECVLALKEMVEPPINTISWISNISTGTPKEIRSSLNSFFLTYLAGAGLDAAIVNVLDRDIMKAVYLVKSFRDEIIFSPADIA